MHPERLRALLEALRDGDIDVHSALSQLTPGEIEGYATIDTARQLRVGVPEVIYGEGKTADQIVGILRHLRTAGQSGLATRVDAEKAAAICAALPEAEYDAIARILTWSDGPPERVGRGTILVICAGTSDLPVAREALLVARHLGNEARMIADVGVAGLHRILRHRGALDDARVVIVVAGMEGALPSVVAGLTDRPVIAVPTSVGYGAAFGGIAALLGMLNSCASGVSVVNIDNGFGAAYQASQINRLP